MSSRLSDGCGSESRMVEPTATREQLSSRELNRAPERATSQWEAKSYTTHPVLFVLGDNSPAPRVISKQLYDARRGGGWHVSLSTLARTLLLPAGKSSQRVHPIKHIHQLVCALVERDVDKRLAELAEQPAHAAIPRRVRFPIAGRGHGCAVGRLVGSVGVRVSRRQCTPAKGRGGSARRVCTAPRQCSGRNTHQSAECFAHESEHSEAATSRSRTTTAVRG
eukprot:scaffold27659_cov65-Phaeocystis_antarctica.AAC.2